MPSGYRSPTELDYRQRATKRLVSNFIIGGLSRKIRRGLWFPGEQLLDYREAVATGVVGPGTVAWFIERVPSVQRRIRRQMQRDFPTHSYYLHNAELDSLPLTSASTGKPVMFDYVYLDTCGNFSAARCRWLAEELRPALAKGAALAVTIVRNNHTGVMSRWQEVLESHYPRFLTSTQKIWNDATGGCLYRSTKAAEIPIEPPAKLAGAIVTPAYSRQSLLAAAILRVLIPEARPLHCLEYCDRQTDPAARAATANRGMGGGTFLTCLNTRIGAPLSVPRQVRESLRETLGF